MTRKDYVLIAKAITDTQRRINNTLSSPQVRAFRDGQLRGVRRVAAHLSAALAEDNPRFDVGMFLSACGYGPTTMNPRDPALDLRPLPDEDGMPLEQARTAAGLVNDMGEEAMEKPRCAGKPVGTGHLALENSRAAWAKRETPDYARRPICEGLEDEPDLGDVPRNGRS